MINNIFMIDCSSTQFRHWFGRGFSRNAFGSRIFNGRDTSQCWFLNIEGGETQFYLRITTPLFRGE